MPDEAVKVAKGIRKPKARKFYQVRPDFRSAGLAGFQVENLSRLLLGRLALGPAPGRRGFPSYPEAPRLLFDKKLGRAPRDLEQYHDYWLISDRMKTVLEAVDPDGGAFVRCEVRLRDGEPGPAYWLCDVIRVLDAVDEAASQLMILERAGQKLYAIMGGTKLTFREDAVGSAHVCRLTYSIATVICDQTFKDSCKSAGLKGIAFTDVNNS